MVVIEMAANTNITGMTDGTADIVVAANRIEGGVANKVTEHRAQKISNTNIEGCEGVTTMGDVSGNEVNITNHSRGPGGAQSLVAQSKPKGINEYTVKDIEELLKKDCFPDAVIKKFVENGIDGKYFMNLATDDVLEELNVNSPLQKMKIKTLIDQFDKK